jgi:hypothetical protein
MEEIWGKRRDGTCTAEVKELFVSSQWELKAVREEAAIFSKLILQEMDVQRSLVRIQRMTGVAAH